MGFLPDAGSWAQLKREALSFVLSQSSRLGASATNELVRRINEGGPEAARTLAAMTTLVPSRELPNRYEPALVPLGKAFFLEYGSDWYGSLDLRDREAMKLVASYRDQA